MLNKSASFLLVLTLLSCGKANDSSDDKTEYGFETQCAADVNYIYSTKSEAEADRAAKYAELTSYSTTQGEIARNVAEEGLFSVTATWSTTSLSVADATKNTLTLDFLDKSGNAASTVNFNREENPTLFMMDMKMMTVAHSNYLCKMQTDAMYTVSGNKLTITNVNFVMASDKAKATLWFINHLKATVDGATDTVKRLDVVPDVMM